MRRKIQSFSQEQIKSAIRFLFNRDGRSLVEEAGEHKPVLDHLSKSKTDLVNFIPQERELIGDYFYMTSPDAYNVIGECDPFDG